MNFLQSPYNNTEEEYNEIISFLTQIGKLNQYLFWDPGRMNFWRCSVHGRKAQNDPFFIENVRVWKYNNKIIGLFISEYGKNDAFIEVHPNFKMVYSEIFKWINNHWSANRDKVEMDVISGNEDKIRILENNGYIFNCHNGNLYYYHLDNINLDYNLEKGFNIIAFFENPNIQSRVELVRNVFNNKKYNEKNLLKIQSSPDYKKELDICVMSPKNQFVAYCIGWHDSIEKHLGYIEPVGTHSQYRKRGFASAVIKECFKRLKKHDIKEVEIASQAEPAISNYLYNSLQPSYKKKIYKYCKIKKINEKKL